MEFLLFSRYGFDIVIPIPRVIHLCTVDKFILFYFYLITEALFLAKNLPIFVHQPTNVCLKLKSLKS